MNAAILGGFEKRLLSHGWTKETALALAGGGEFDLTNIAPGDDAHLTAIAIFGGIDITVDEGTQVTMTGFSLLGGRDIDVTPATDGPVIHLRAIAILGSVHVKSPNDE